jgi:hypothetical protein
MSSERLSQRFTTKPTSEEQDAADRAEDAHISCMRSWKDEWRSGLHAALVLAIAIRRRDWLIARDAFYHLEILFKDTKGAAA